MKQMFVPISLLFFILSSCTKNVSPETTQLEGERMNGLNALNTLSFIDNNSVWKDVAGNDIKAQGGFIVKEAGVYHWFGPQFGTGNDYHFYAINHYTSDDLQNWTKQAAALAPGMSGVPMNSGSWVGRPWVIKNPNNNNFVMGIEWGSSGVAGVRNQYAFFTSSSINGPWAYQSNKLIQKLPDVNNTLYPLGDMGVYTEGNDAWILYTFDKPQANYAQAIVKLDTDFMTPLPHSVANSYTEFSGGTWKAGVQEAATIFKRGSTYYYFTSLCNGWNSSETRYRTASSVAGPWTANAIVPANPSSTNSYNTQHDFVLPITGTAGTTFMYCGDRWSNYTGNGVGLYGWYPLTFDASGVPTINAPGTGDWVLDLAAGTWSTPSANVLLNPGFESDLSNWVATGNAGISTIAAELHSGVKSFKTWSSAAYTTTLQNTATNQASGNYTAGVWSRGSGTFSQRVLQVFVNNVMVREKTLPLGTSWRNDTIRNVAVPAGANVKVGISFNAAASAWTQVDDFELIKQ